MGFRRKPPSIHFYEDKSLTQSPFFSSRLTSFFRFCTFGLVKTDVQATMLVLLLVIAGMVATLLYTKQLQGVVPTTTYELLPQEKVGSEQGMPPQPIRTYEE